MKKRKQVKIQISEKFDMYLNIQFSGHIDRSTCRHIGEQLDRQLLGQLSGQLSVQLYEHLENQTVRDLK